MKQLKTIILGGKELKKFLQCIPVATPHADTDSDEEKTV